MAHTTSPIDGMTNYVPSLVTNVLVSLHHWPTLLLVAATIILLNQARRSLWLLSIVALPGTFAHELAHFVVGCVLLAKPASLSVWPKREGNTYLLGSVTFGGVGIFNGVFVALAPLLLLLPAAYGCFLMAVTAWRTDAYPVWAAWGVLAGNFLYGSIPSDTDVKLGLTSMLFYAVTGAGLWWATR